MRRDVFYTDQIPEFLLTVYTAVNTEQLPVHK